MKRILLVGLFLGSLSVSAQSEDVLFDDRWYAGVMGGVARPGDDRLTELTTPYFGAYLGRFFSPDFSLDLQIDSYSADFDRDELNAAGIMSPAASSPDFDIYGYGLTGRYYAGDMGDKHRFYGLAGLGIAEHDNFLDEGRDMYVSLGAGVQSRFSENIRLRTQLEGRYDNDRQTRSSDDGFIDFILSVGLSFSFGEPPRPPQPTRAAPPQEPVRAAPPSPPPAPRPQPEPEVMFEFDSTVLFDFDSSALRAEARAELDRASDILAPRDDIILIEVAGHTDDIGTNEYNQDLSIRRGQSVADYLVQNGVSRDRLRVVGYGETRPKVPNTSPENRQQNRRVVLSILNRRN